MNSFRIARRPTHSRYDELFDAIVQTIETEDAIYVPKVIGRNNSFVRSFRIQYPSLRLRSKTTGLGEVALWAEFRDPDEA